MTQQINPAAGRPILNNVDGIRQVNYGNNPGITRIEMRREVLADNPGAGNVIAPFSRDNGLCKTCGADLNAWAINGLGEHRHFEKEATNGKG